MIKASLLFVAAVAATTEDANITANSTTDVVNTTLGVEPESTETETDETDVTTRFLAKSSKHHHGPKHHHGHHGHHGPRWFGRRFGRGYGGYGRGYGYRGYGGWGDYGNFFGPSGVLRAEMRSFFPGLTTGAVVSPAVFNNCAGQYSFNAAWRVAPPHVVNCFLGSYVPRQLNNWEKRQDHRLRKFLRRNARKARRFGGLGRPAWWSTQYFGNFRNFGGVECVESVVGVVDACAQICGDMAWDANILRGCYTQKKIVFVQ